MDRVRSRILGNLNDLLYVQVERGWSGAVRLFQEKAAIRDPAVLRKAVFVRVNADRAAVHLGGRTRGCTP